MITPKRDCYINLLGKIEDLDIQIERIKDQLRELRHIVRREKPPNVAMAQPAPPSPQEEIS